MTPRMYNIAPPPIENIFELWSSEPAYLFLLTGPEKPGSKSEPVGMVGRLKKHGEWACFVRDLNHVEVGVIKRSCEWQDLPSSLQDRIDRKIESARRAGQILDLDLSEVAAAGVEPATVRQSMETLRSQL